MSQKSNENDADGRLIMFLLKKMAMEGHCNRAASQAISLLADFLARAQDVIADEDWETIACVGALLWRAKSDEVETSRIATDLMDRIQRQK